MIKGGPPFCINIMPNMKPFPEPMWFFRVYDRDHQEEIGTGFADTTTDAMAQAIKMKVDKMLAEAGKVNAEYQDLMRRAEAIRKMQECQEKLPPF